MHKFRIFVILVLSMFTYNSYCQFAEDNYQYVLSVDPLMNRKLMANEIMFDKQEKYLVVNYGNKPSYIIVYETATWTPVANFRLSNWVEFTGSYFDYETNQIYIKEGRYSSEYYRLDINTGITDIIGCELAPGGCPVIEPRQAQKSAYTSNKLMYATINKRNARDVRIYKLKAN
ncbi:MAG: hypothetical protein JEZ09_19290 [Salinivirgaceae bacterium]|nr:hypothetical protein [Salinivirgaceae bacterium]